MLADGREIGCTHVYDREIFETPRKSVKNADIVCPVSGVSELFDLPQTLLLYANSAARHRQSDAINVQGRRVPKEREQICRETSRKRTSMHLFTASNFLDADHTP